MFGLMMNYGVSLEYLTTLMMEQARKRQDSKSLEMNQSGTIVGIIKESLEKMTGVNLRFKQF